MDNTAKRKGTGLVPDVIIVAPEAEPHTKAVVDYLQIKHPKVEIAVVDTANFPQKMDCKIAINDHVRVKFAYAESFPISLEKVRSVWWWRPQLPMVDQQIQDVSKAEFAYRECCQTIEGIWYITDCLWVNQPEKQEVALNRLNQLYVAKACGFAIPDTLVTNSPSAVMEFFDNHDGEVYYKQLVPLTPKSFKLTTEVLKKLGQLSLAPLMFQKITKLDAMLHIYAIGDKIFSGRVLLTTSQKGPEKHLKKYPLPQNIEARVNAMMRQIGLVYGRFEVGINHDANFVFFDLDPTVGFLAEEKQLGVPMTELMGELLLRGKREARETRGLSPMGG